MHEWLPIHLYNPHLWILFDIAWWCEKSIVHFQYLIQIWMAIVYENKIKLAPNCGSCVCMGFCRRILQGNYHCDPVLKSLPHYPLQKNVLPLLLATDYFA